MANHKSSEKELDKQKQKRANNRYYAKTARNAVKKLRSMTEKGAAIELFPRVASMLDKLAKKNVIHTNKAANIKSKLALHINSL